MDIALTSVTKRFSGGVTALDRVSFTVTPGMFGLLGPNGAGKTTLMRILSTLLEPDQGSVAFGEIDLREDPQAVRRLIGYLPQELGFYRQLTGPEYLDLVAGMKGLSAREARPETARLLEQVNLAHQRKKRIGEYSGGMRRRLGIAQALLGDPQVIIVDEPTAGLDPEERLRFRNLLADLSAQRTILLSTHIVADVETTCERLAVLNRGHLLYAGPTEQLLEQADGQVWQLDLDAREFERVRHTLQIVSARRSGPDVSLRVIAGENPFGGAVRTEPTLEDGYLCLMQSAGAAIASAQEVGA